MISRGLEIISSALTFLIESISLPFLTQLSIPSDKYPSILSKPTLASLFIVSFSLFLSVTSKIGVLISPITLPAHGAKFPSSPIKRLLGI
jgi:hypothetical protein